MPANRARPDFARDLAAELAREIRQVRQAFRWSQRELAVRAGVSQSTVSRVERGLGANVDLDLVGRIVDVLGLRVHITAERPVLLGQTRQRDLGHSAGVGYVARHLGEDRFVVATEVEVGEGRYRGWIDLLAWDRASGSVLVVEFKTELHDIGAVDRQLRLYEREAWAAARRLGWEPRRVASVLVLLHTSWNAAAVRDNRDVLAAAFPATAADVLEWIRAPATMPARGRGLAAVDPRARRRGWLLSAGLDGRRRPPRYSGYADFIGQHRPKRRARAA